IFTMFLTLPHDHHFFLTNQTPTTQIYTLSLHDALPICAAIAGHIARSKPLRHFCRSAYASGAPVAFTVMYRGFTPVNATGAPDRSEEHTSELQSRGHLVCRLLLEKKILISEELINDVRI